MTKARRHISLTPQATHRLRRLALDLEISEDDALSFLLENIDFMIVDEAWDARVRRFKKALSED